MTAPMVRCAPSRPMPSCPNCTRRELPAGSLVLDAAAIAVDGICLMFDLKLPAKDRNDHETLAHL